MVGVKWENYGDLPEHVMTLEFLRSMTNEQAKKYFGHKKCVATKLYYAIVMAGRKIKWGGWRGVREFWYNPVKPIALRWIGTIVNTESQSRMFETYLSDMVKQGLVTYAELGIKDYSTQRALVEDIERAKCWSNVVLFVEKDSAYMYLQKLKELLNITLLSGRGWSKTAAAEDILNYLDTSKKYKFFLVTDYDPYGFDIGRECPEKFETLGMSIDEVVRICVKPEQLTKDELSTQLYEVDLRLKGAERWCQQHGLGPNKKYGIELDALMGRTDGHKQFRMTVLEEILKHLDEDDRIMELTEDAWESMPWEAARYYLDPITWNSFTAITLPTPLKEYITTEAYNMRKIRIEINKKLAIAPGQERLEEMRRKIENTEELRNEAIGENYSKYETLIDEANTEHIEPLEEEIWEIEKSQIHPIRREINELKKKHIEPLKKSRDYHEGMIRDSYNRDISDYEGEEKDIEETLEETKGKYDTEFSVLDDMYRKSRAIFGQAVYSWLCNHSDEYYERGLDDEDCCMGITRGFLEDACRREETVQDVIKTIEEWDKEKPYSYITDEMETYSMDEVMGHVSIYFEKCREKFEEEEE